MENIWESSFEDKQSKVEEPKEEFVIDGMSDDLSILLNFGRLTTSFDFLGHHFTMQTLKMSEELRATSIASSYLNALDQGAKAIIAALVAASIVTVDGSELVSSLGPDDSSVLERKFNYILDKYYWIVVEELYTEYAKLVDRLNLALAEFKKK